MSKFPFPVDPVMTAIVVAFRNKRLIADEVLPRVPVGKKEFKYYKFTFEESFTVPNTRVGRRSKPNEVSFSAKETTDACEDFGLDDPVPQDDINEAPANYNPLNRSAEGLMDLVLLDREIRAANLVFDANKYNAANKVVLAGGDQFSDFVASDPIEVIMDCLDSMIMRGNVAIFGRAAFSKVIRHPKVLKAVHGNSGDSGVATRRQIAELFELEDVLVGEALFNTAKKGETASLSRAWGKHISLIYRDRMADTSGKRMTFGFTAERGSRIAGAAPDKNIGLRGGQMVRVGETVKELITSDRLGYFIQNAVA